MKQIATSLVLVLLVISSGAAQDGASVKEIASEEPKAQTGAATADAAEISPLKELDWMVGKWVDQGDDTTITTTCSWRHDGKFLSRAFKITTSGEVTLEGTQVIGWDPIEGQIRSWTFDSAGGFGEGRWLRDGARWLVKTSFVLATGERASAINIITYVDQDTLLWESTNREVAGELQLSIAEVTVVRQKPEETETRQGAKEVSP
jgi:hypothetical protein